MGKIKYWALQIAGALLMAVWELGLRVRGWARRKGWWTR